MGLAFASAIIAFHFVFFCVPSSNQQSPGAIQLKRYLKKFPTKQSLGGVVRTTLY